MCPSVTRAVDVVIVDSPTSEGVVGWSLGGCCQSHFVWRKTQQARQTGLLGAGLKGTQNIKR